MALLDFWRTWRARRRQLAAERLALHRGIEELVDLVDPRLRGRQPASARALLFGDYAIGWPKSEMADRSL